MRVIKSDSGHLVYQKIFKHLQANNSIMVVWQLFPQTGQRVVSQSKLNSYHMETGLLHFDVNSENPLMINQPVYCYSEEGQFIFKSSIQVQKNNIVSMDVPSEIKLLEDPDVTVIKGNSGVDLAQAWKTRRLDLMNDTQPDIMVVKSMSQRTARDQEFLNNEFNPTLDEEDKMFADQRESPRARPKVDKWVKIKSSTSDEVHYLKLFDLSQGGIGFLTLEIQHFPKGEEVRVVGFEEYNLDDPLFAKIMSHRPVDDTQIEYKVGCKFVDGQN